MVILNETIKESYLMAVAILSGHNLLHSTISEKVQKHTDLKEELIRIRPLRTTHNVHQYRPLLVLFQTS
jgi:hypothetical protein